MHQFHFTFENIKSQYYQAKESGYEIITCEKYYQLKKENNIPYKCIVNRIDIDLSIKKTEILVNMFNEIGIQGTFFIRLHAKEYNPFSFENYRIIKKLIDSGHELGYHSEVIDQSVIWNEDVGECLKRDIDIINGMFRINIKGVASHGGMTGLNNLDFWKDKKPGEFGLLYEAYEWFKDVFYVSDSEWTRWKCYSFGELVKGDNKSFAEHLSDGHQIINIVIHPETYFNKHFYE